MVDQSAPTGALLSGAWAALCGDPILLDMVEVTGHEMGLLSSSLPVLPAMMAAVSASTLAASVLDAARCGAAMSRVQVDAEHVAIASRSERYARQDGAGEATRGPSGVGRLTSVRIRPPSADPGCTATHDSIATARSVRSPIAHRDPRRAVGV